MRLARRALVLAALLALGACASLPRVPPAPPTAGERGALEALVDWQASGRVAIRTEREGWNASFDWREAGGRGEIGVRGPFGAGATHVTRTARSIRIATGSAAPLEIAAPFDALEPALIARLGFPLPLANLRWWLLGIPAPGEPHEGLPLAFQQAGWSVNAEDVVAVAGAPAPLPRRLVLTREATRIRVVVDRWEVASR